MGNKILGFVFAAAVLLAVAVPLLGGGGTAQANHSHFVVLPDGATCVWLTGAGNTNGANTGQEGAAASLVNPVSDPNTLHPLHNLVHLGNPGSGNDGTSAVDVDKDANAGSRCTNGFVND